MNYEEKEVAKAITEAEREELTRQFPAFPGDEFFEEMDRVTVERFLDRKTKEVKEEPPPKHQEKVDVLEVILKEKGFL